jgi:hypothetical protein
MGLGMSGFDRNQDGLWRVSDMRTIEREREPSQETVNCTTLLLHSKSNPRSPHSTPPSLMQDRSSFL